MAKRVVKISKNSYKVVKTGSKQKAQPIIKSPKKRR